MEESPLLIQLIPNSIKENYIVVNFLSKNSLENGLNNLK